MEVYVTTKTEANDYLKNTTSNALVHINRLMSANDVTNAPLTIKIEELNTINGFFLQQRQADGQVIEDPPIVTFLGNNLTITTFTNGDKFTIFVFGT